MNDKDAGVVVIGAGFAGLYAARELGEHDIPVTVIDKRNYHLFQPLLYQVATASLSPAEIAEPIRKVLRNYRSVNVVLDEVVGISRAKRLVTLASGRTVPYGRLIVATGATHSYFGQDQWRELAPGLKTIPDATALRARILGAFEAAEAAETDDERSRLLTFVVVGGGPTGVEMAGAIAEIAKRTLVRDFRHIQSASARILLVEGNDRVLSSFSDPLSEHARKRLESLGVDVVLSTLVGEIGETGLRMGETWVPAGTVVWAAGVAASPVGRLLEGRMDRVGRVQVTERLSLPDDDAVFVAGDLAHAIDPDTQAPLPGLAQVAKQQGIYLGKALAAHLKHGDPMPVFRYRSRGNVAIIGRHAAVFEGPRVRLRGWVAWLFWAVIHIYLLLGFRNRLLVCLNWAWRYMTDDRGARLILEDTARARTARADAPQGTPAKDR